VREAARRPGFWAALALSVTLGVFTIWLLTSTLEVSFAAGAIVLDCGTAVDPRTEPRVTGAIVATRESCDDKVYKRRVASGVMAGATVVWLVLLGVQINRAQDDEPAIT
jgi:hypothetical protein